jgi:hypothetical protein
MVLIIVLLAVAIVLLALTFLFFTGMPDSRLSTGRRVKWMFLASTLCVAAGMAVAITIKIQENTGTVTGLSGGVESDARQWISRNSPQAPVADQAGDNIKILREGLLFLRSHPAIGNTPEASSLMQRYSGLPERPTRLLTHQEETQYYEGAQAVWRLISGIAQGSNSE